MEGNRSIIINLLPTDNQPQVSKILLIGMLFIAILGGITGFFYQSTLKNLAEQKNLNTKLRTEITEFNKDDNSINRETKREIKKLQSSVQALERIQGSHGEALLEIEKSVPSSMVMTGIEIQAKKVVITGFAPQHRDVSTFLAGLRESSVFKNIAVLSSQLNEDTNMETFKIEMDWEAKR